MDQRFENLKNELFARGCNAIEDFLGYDIRELGDLDKDAIDNLMDEVHQQMPDEELKHFFQKYNVA